AASLSINNSYCTNPTSESMFSSRSIEHPSPCALHATVSRLHHLHVSIGITPVGYCLLTARSTVAYRDLGHGRCESLLPYAMVVIDNDRGRYQQHDSDECARRSNELLWSRLRHFIQNVLE
ncbi:hypothetical protein PMAYCL1PPCAC_20179, partial [Pristionchus mayeri]